MIIDRVATNNQSYCWIEQLPDELLLRIFTYCSQQEVINSLSLVCRHWKVLSHTPDFDTREFSRFYGHCVAYQTFSRFANIEFWSFKLPNSDWSYAFVSEPVLWANDRYFPELHRIIKAKKISNGHIALSDADIVRNNRYKMRHITPDEQRLLLKAIQEKKAKISFDFLYRGNSVHSLCTRRGIYAERLAQKVATPRSLSSFEPLSSPQVNNAESDASAPLQNTHRNHHLLKQFKRFFKSCFQAQ